jgi:hypothetical protein
MPISTDYQHRRGLGVSARRLSQVACALLAALLAGHASAKQVIGRIEAVTLTTYGLTLDAKIDTGADTSSINGPDTRFYEAGGTARVAFSVPDAAGAIRHIDEPVLRMVRINRAGAPDEERAVIKLAICMAGIATTAEFTVADRSELRYQMLIGRSVLAPDFLVDVSVTHTAPANCPSKNSAVSPSGGTELKE